MRIAAENDLQEPARAQNRPSSPPSHRPHSRTRARNLSKNLSVHLVLAMHRPPYACIALWRVECIGEVERDLFRLWVSYASS